MGSTPRDGRVGTLAGSRGIFCSGMEFEAFLHEEATRVGDRGRWGLGDAERPDAITAPVIASEDVAQIGSVDLAGECCATARLGPLYAGARARARAASSAR